MRKQKGKARITAAERRDQAITLALSGATYAQIAAQIGVSRSRAHQYIEEALAASAQESAGKASLYREKQLARTERMLMGIWQRTIKGDLHAIDRAIKLLERQAKLTGLDQPTKIAPTNPEGTAAYNADNLSDAERAARIAELERILDRRKP